MWAHPRDPLGQCEHDASSFGWRGRNMISHLPQRQGAVRNMVYAFNMPQQAHSRNSHQPILTQATNMVPTPFYTPQQTQPLQYHGSIRAQSAAIIGGTIDRHWQTEAQRSQMVSSSAQLGPLTAGNAQLHQRGKPQGIIPWGLLQPSQTLPANHSHHDHAIGLYHLNDHEVVNEVERISNRQAAARPDASQGLDPVTSESETLSIPVAAQRLHTGHHEFAKTASGLDGRTRARGSPYHESDHESQQQQAHESEHSHSHTQTLLAVIKDMRSREVQDLQHMQDLRAVAQGPCSMSIFCESARAHTQPVYFCAYCCPAHVFCSALRP